ncbi:MAG: gliding motility-associated C-terminal domain-containing protein [Flavobacteriales bacterium]|nr:gliding motility-associated C-terminal domain-containing protein [Flavobacteriales bacterium]
MRAIHFLLFFALALVAAAQPPNDDCSTAATLCAQQPLTGNNTGATGWPGFCPATGNVLWYTFTTNSVGGTVDVSISGINCPGVAGMDNELSVVVLSGDGSCTANAFVSVGDCQNDSADFTITTTALLPNTQYWVVVAGAANNGATIPAQCGFSVVTSGPGADIVGVDFYAGPDVTLGEGGSAQLQATGGTTYTWTPTSGLSGSNIPDPIAQPEETTTYTVTTQLNGCTYSDQVIVEVNRPISPPNTITPNGDDINDTWEIFGIQDYPQATVSIYDRWGQRVFNSVGYKTPFDGGGLPTATYYWIIQLSQLDGVAEPYTGFLTIVN